MTENLSRKTARRTGILDRDQGRQPGRSAGRDLATIARVNPKLNAIVTLVADAARGSAQGRRGCG